MYLNDHVEIVFLLKTIVNYMLMGSLQRSWVQIPMKSLESYVSVRDNKVIVINLLLLKLSR